MKVGFIVEGDCEKLLVESAMFREWAARQGIQVHDPVINARGNGNLCPKNIPALIQELRSGESVPDCVVVLTDQECDPCIGEARARLGTGHDRLVVARKALEAWLVADSLAMGKWLNEPEFHEPRPEHTCDEMPWEYIKRLARDLGRRGPGTKPAFMKKFLNKFSFSVERAAAHPGCPSMVYFLNTLRGLAAAGASKAAPTAGTAHE